MADHVIVLVGTSQGVFIYTAGADRRAWRCRGPYLPDHEVASIVGDARRGRRIVAGVSDGAGKAGIWTSDDLGASWTPATREPRYAAASGFAVTRVWHLAAGPPDEPDTYYAGVEEAGLFASRDGGRTWAEMQSLTRHPTRPNWFPGNGGLCLHTILGDPTRPGRMWVAMSAVGVFRTDDGGQRWTVCTNGLARHPNGSPEPAPATGYCVHKLAQDPRDPSLLYLQDHAAVLRSADGADSWHLLEDGLPAMRAGQPVGSERPFGFALDVAPTGDVFLVPLPGGAGHDQYGTALPVYRLDHGAEHWSVVSTIQPDESSRPARAPRPGPSGVKVLRDALATDDLAPYGLYAGATSGELFCSLDRGATWDRLGERLPRIIAVKAWTLTD